ncbi:RNase E specificity factor CsrD [Mariprofundus micogutta]|uniref:RNase E specificity factor CsrD n=1 Tax=Mariprofundus micogutta TaxID=1921010 RepID=A0A1L8CM52_9PROT|nr:EAL domain-containing protein [Mariprofundus micogutta]GAV19998.1 RNase E specificity factor CsrD [Mariprofundus micogutta]
MTLSRQLYILILSVSVMMGAGTWLISVDNTRTYLMLQMATQTQNTADSLGLSLVPHMKARDIAVMDTMINAVFDSGYYKSLSLKSMQGEVLIERENTSSIEDVPEWFINGLKLDSPQASSIITTGWTQSGTLNLEAHPGFAYKKLWDTSYAMLWWSLLVIIISFLVSFMALKAILKPLYAVEKQALAICDREFPVVTDIPKTRELKKMVEAMNMMTAKVQSFISMLTERAEKYREQAHYDEMTHLMNRNGFKAVVENCIKDQEHAGSGFVALIRLADFAAYNKKHGHQDGDNLIIEVARLIDSLCDSYHGSTAARIGGIDFAVLLPLADPDTTSAFGHELSCSLEGLSSNHQVEAIGHIGLASFHQNSSFGDILADADTALASAQSQGNNEYNILSSNNDAMGNQAWAALIKNALSHNNVRFIAQPVMDQNSNSIYSELLMRVIDDAGKEIRPGPFAAMAERLALNEKLDQFVIQRATTLLEHATDQNSILGVNISAASVKSSTFSTWLEKHLQTHNKAAARLLFEITEHGVLQSFGEANHFVDIAQANGARIVMEHFGTRLSSFQSLRQLKLDYIKLDGSFVRNIADNSDNRFFLQTVTDIAHGLDIQVIAEHVENVDDFHALQALGINAMQGYYFGEPQPIS